MQSLVIDVLEVMGDYHHKLNQLVEPIPPKSVQMEKIKCTLLDVLAVLDSLDEIELQAIKEDPCWGYMSNGMVYDPIEALHFDIVEHLTTVFVKMTGGLKRPSGIRFDVYPFVIIEY